MQKTQNQKIQVLAEALNVANSEFLSNNKSPSRKVGELDTRGSHFYLSMYWAQALAAQGEDKELQAVFGPIAQQLTENEDIIVSELNAVQGKPVDIEGYYRPNRELASRLMRPSDRFNQIIDQLSGLAAYE